MRTGEESVSRNWLQFCGQVLDLKSQKLLSFDRKAAEETRGSGLGASTRSCSGYEPCRRVKACCGDEARRAGAQPATRGWVYTGDKELGLQK